MTEDEAKMKICCGPPASANATYWRGGAMVEDSPMKCGASVCMAWRWTVTPELAAAFTKARAENPKSEGPTEADGYCGLAGNR